MKLLLIYFCILFLSCQAVVAQKAVVRGCVTDAKTGEILSDANVLERRSGTGWQPMLTDFIPYHFPKGNVYCNVPCWGMLLGEIP